MSANYLTTRYTLAFFLSLTCLLAACGTSNMIEGTASTSSNSQTTQTESNDDPFMQVSTSTIDYAICSQVIEAEFIRPESNELVVEFAITEHLFTLFSDPNETVTGSYTINFDLQVLRHIEVSELEGTDTVADETVDSIDGIINGLGPDPISQDYSIPNGIHTFTVPLAGLSGSHLKLKAWFDDWASVQNQGWSGLERLDNFCAGSITYVEGTQALLEINNEF